MQDFGPFSGSGILVVPVLRILWGGGVIGLSYAGLRVERFLQT